VLGDFVNQLQYDEYSECVSDFGGISGSVINYSTKTAVYLNIEITEIHCIHEIHRLNIKIKLKSRDSLPVFGGAA